MNTYQDVRIVIFDCDGVMFDSKKLNKAYYNALLERLGLSRLSEDEEDYVHMHTMTECVELVLNNRGEEGKRHLPTGLAVMQKIDYRQFLELMTIEPSLKEVLEYLRPCYRTAIATNRTTTMALVMETWGLSQLFDMVVTALDVENPKPHPEALLKILGRFSLTPDQAVYVGDSELDREAAVRANIPFFSYRNPRLDAVRHLSSLSELKPLLPVTP